jgi:DNA mismatch endonuclease (patch repair protein)
MTDTMSKSERSKAMSKVRSADTKPEWILRCALQRAGFRYRLRDRRLPGRPDLVFPRYGAVVFVHGCYWHRHADCKDASTPKSNISFWAAKFAENVQRDGQKTRELELLGWRTLVVWECELVMRTPETIRRVAAWLRQGRPCAAGPSDDARVVDRGALLAVAEEKVRYRIASYDGRPKLKSDSGASEAREP